MATSEDYIEFVIERLESAGTHLEFWYRRMFGEYCVYADEKPLFFVFNNTVFIKRLAELTDLLAHCDNGEPYPGAKGWAILDVECEERLGEILSLLYKVKPLPKPKKRKSKTTK